MNEFVCKTDIFQTLYSRPTIDLPPMVQPHSIQIPIHFKADSLLITAVPSICHMFELLSVKRQLDDYLVEMLACRTGGPGLGPLVENQEFS